jgi:thiamine-phosphate diphosphorylase
MDWRPPVVCLVTPGAGSDPSSQHRVLTHVRAAAAAGVSLVQVREPDLDDGALCRLVSGCVQAVAGTSCRVVVNDRLDVALAAGAHGVHLRADSFPAERARRLAPRPFLMGRSVHSAAEAAELALEGSVDYVIFGTVFPSLSKSAVHPVAGVAALARAVRAAAPVPVLAIGGITTENASDVATVGAAGVAAIALFSRDHGPRPMHDIVASLRSAFANVRTTT